LAMKGNESLSIGPGNERSLQFRMRLQSSPPCQ
jgi:hypothetical protein